MAYTRGQWAQAFLTAIGNPNPTAYTVNWVVCWTQYETACCGGASYNLLNTTQTLPGSTNFNNLSGGGGVQNFVSFAQGILANAIVLRNGLYSSLLAALSSNNEAALRSAGQNGIAPNLKTWGTSHAADIANCAASPNVKSLDSFGGSSLPPPTGSGGAPPPTQTDPQPPTQACLFQCQGKSGQDYTDCLIACMQTSAGNNPFSPGGIGSAISSIGNFFGALGAIIPWISNPLRIIKMLAGIMFVGISIWMLASPEATKVVIQYGKKVGIA